MSDNILIIGNNFSGLGAALALAKYGYSSHIVAPKKNVSPSGGLQIAPNALNALSTIGIKDDIINVANQIKSIEVKYLDTSISLASLTLPQGDMPYLSMARADLHKILETACDDTPLINYIDSNVSAISQRGNQAQLVLETPIAPNQNKIITASTIIGADGWHGKTRHFVCPTAQQSKTDVIILRGGMPADQLPKSFSGPATQLWIGDACHLVSYPIKQSTEINFIFSVALHKLSRGSAHQLFASHPMLHVLADACINWHAATIPSFQELSNWRRGAATLIGDAAHPMPPHLAQGAGQSFMDIASLAKWLEAGYQPANALSKMIDERMSDANSVARKSKFSGQILRLKGRSANLRDKLIGLAGDVFIDDWLQDVWQTH